jgi:hypothetical protein
MAQVMTRRPVRWTDTVNDELGSLMVHLTREYPELAAGSVLRCVARVAHGLRIAGWPDEALPAESERVSRRLLAMRAGRAPAR